MEHSLYQRTSVSAFHVQLKNVHMGLSATQQLVIVPFVQHPHVGITQFLIKYYVNAQIAVYQLVGMEVVQAKIIVIVQNVQKNFVGIEATLVTIKIVHVQVVLAKSVGIIAHERCQIVTVHQNLLPVLKILVPITKLETIRLASVRMNKIVEPILLARKDIHLMITLRVHVYRYHNRLNNLAELHVHLDNI